MYVFMYSDYSKYSSQLPVLKQLLNNDLIIHITILFCEVL